ncbi:MAG TPA: phosphatase PAP2 family protein [Thermoanaerobaculia bacterium]|nr:phosphatase PAP2 family protein [Thermoanaerobaculia bacterium]
MVAESLTRPYPVTIPMILLVSMVPLYIFIADVARYGSPRAPEIALDRLIPLQPAWSLVYGALYLFLIALPVFVVRQPDHIARTVLAYLTIWTTAYVFFLGYPTVAPRGDEVAGVGFGAWGLRLLYGADPPYNCFPSLHVAHSFVSALTCWRLHRELGIASLFAAALVAISTLYTKQHYVADVVAGIALAFLAYAIFLRRYPRERVPDLDRRLAPVLAALLLALIGVGLGCFWIAYKVSGAA